MSDSDDDVRLPMDTMAILQEYLLEQNNHDENWQMSQFWYDEATTAALTRAVTNLRKDNSNIALLSCPTLMQPLLDEKSNVVLFEFDRRFEKFEERFQFFDYNFPTNLDEKYKGIYDVIVADPPFLSDECLNKFFETIDFVKTKSARIILCTGAVMESLAKNYGLNVCGFVPEHKKKYGYLEDIALGIVQWVNSVLVQKHTCVSGINLPDLERP